MSDTTIDDRRAESGAARDKDLRIIVNARPHEWEDRDITFDQVVKLAFPQPPAGNTIYTVTYRRGPPPRPEGTMVEGSVVAVKTGEVFNVTATDKS